MSATSAVAETTAPNLRRCVLDEPPASTPMAPVVAGLGAAALHAALVLLALMVGSLGVARSAATTVPTSELFDIELPPPSREEAAAPVAPAAPEAAASPRVTSRPAAARTREAPPRAAAQAGQVLTAPAEVVDFGDSFVAGDSATYAGGTTEAGGTATHAVRDTTARADGVEGGTGTDLAGDRSRAPALAGGARWDCPFPREADDAGVDHAVVSLRVEVGADGAVQRASATSDPGYGFAREAQRCALTRRWSAGLDRVGRPIAAVALVNVRFDR